MGALGIDGRVICKWILQQNGNSVCGQNSSAVNRRIYCEHDNELLVSIHSGEHIVNNVISLQVSLTVGEHHANMLMILQVPFTVGNIL